MGNISHRYIVFAVPKEFRKYFGKNRNKLKMLPQCAARLLRVVWELNKREGFVMEIVTVIHTFCQNLKCNPHVHMMITEGLAWKNAKCRHISYS